MKATKFNTERLHKWATHLMHGQVKTEIVPVKPGGKVLQNENEIIE